MAMMDIFSQEIEWDEGRNEDLRNILKEKNNSPRRSPRFGSNKNNSFPVLMGPEDEVKGMMSRLQDENIQAKRNAITPRRHNGSGRNKRPHVNFPTRSFRNRKRRLSPPADADFLLQSQQDTENSESEFAKLRAMLEGQDDAGVEEKSKRSGTQNSSRYVSSQQHLSSGRQATDLNEPPSNPNIPDESEFATQEELKGGDKTGDEEDEEEESASEQSDSMSIFLLSQRHQSHQGSSARPSVAAPGKQPSRESQSRPSKRSEKNDGKRPAVSEMKPPLSQSSFKSAYSNAGAPQPSTARSLLHNIDLGRPEQGRKPAPSQNTKERTDIADSAPAHQKVSRTPEQENSTKLVSAVVDRPNAEIEPAVSSAKKPSLSRVVPWKDRKPEGQPPVKSLPSVPAVVVTSDSSLPHNSPPAVATTAVKQEFNEFDDDSDNEFDIDPEQMAAIEAPASSILHGKPLENTASVLKEETDDFDVDDEFDIDPEQLAVIEAAEEKYYSQTQKSAEGTQGVAQSKRMLTTKVWRQEGRSAQPSAIGSTSKHHLRSCVAHPGHPQESHSTRSTINASRVPAPTPPTSALAVNDEFDDEFGEFDGDICDIDDSVLNNATTSPDAISDSVAQRCINEKSSLSANDVLPTRHVPHQPIQPVASHQPNEFDEFDDEFDDDDLLQIDEEEIIRKSQENSQNPRDQDAIAWAEKQQQIYSQQQNQASQLNHQHRQGHVKQHYENLYSRQKEQQNDFANIRHQHQDLDHHQSSYRGHHGQYNGQQPPHQNQQHSQNTRYQHQQQCSPMRQVQQQPSYAQRQKSKQQRRLNSIRAHDERQHPQYPQPTQPQPETHNSYQPQQQQRKPYAHRQQQQYHPQQYHPSRHQEQYHTNAATVNSRDNTEFDDEFGNDFEEEEIRQIDDLTLSNETTTRRAVSIESGANSGDYDEFAGEFDDDDLTGIDLY